MKKFINIALLALVLVGVSSCQQDELDPESIFKDKQQKENMYTEAFDQWLNEYFVKPYNCEFRYQLDDAAMDPNYNVVPVRLGMADTLAHLAQYLWYNVYDTVMQRHGVDSFLYNNGPRMIQLVGSSMINAAQGTEKLGYAEGGIKITLMKINNMDWDNIELINHYIFHTMHHEFSHILHQKKTYPKDFESITPGLFDPTGWQYRYDNHEDDLWLKERNAWKLGFVTCYASSETHEDFVETISSFITETDEKWQLMMESAGQESATLIQQKLDMVTTWLAEQWKISIYQMHLEVMNRQIFLNYDELMKNNFDYHTYPNYDPSKEIKYDASKDVIIMK